jgi:hypothetical protein
VSDHKPTCDTVVYRELDDRYRAKHASDVLDYQQTWPRHCADCRGWGLHLETYDPSPAGVSLGAGTMTDIALCVSCLEEERCPRCCEEAPWIDGVGAHCCTRCGFVEGETEGIPVAPQLSECDCWSLEDLTS